MKLGVAAHNKNGATATPADAEARAADGRFSGRAPAFAVDGGTRAYMPDAATSRDGLHLAVAAGTVCAGGALRRCRTRGREGGGGRRALYYRMKAPRFHAAAHVAR